MSATAMVTGAMSLARLTISYAAVIFFAGMAFLLLAVPQEVWLGPPKNCDSLLPQVALGSGSSFEQQRRLAREHAQCVASRAALDDPAPLTRGEYAQDTLFKTRDEIGILRYTVMGCLALGLLAAAFEMTLTRELPVLQRNLSRISDAVRQEKRRRGR